MAGPGGGGGHASPQTLPVPRRWQSQEQEAVAVQPGVKLLYPPGPILMMPNGAGTIIPFYRRKTEPWSNYKTCRLTYVAKLGFKHIVV